MNRAYSENPVLIWGILRNWLPQIPKLDDLVTLEAEEMNNGDTEVIDVLFEMRKL